MTRILIVDDSNSMRLMVSFILKSAGYEVDESGDGEHALSLAKTLDYDAVISDVNMPKMDGIALIKALRQLKGYPSCPILILTTESSSDKKSEARQAGATGWIVKPFNPEKFVETIKKVLNQGL